MSSFKGLNYDIHTHTHYSDGFSSVYELVKKAETRGLKLLAITYHSFADFDRRMRDIESINETDLIVLNGVEADVALNGSINLPKNRRYFDIVLGSIHSFLNPEKWKKITLEVINSGKVDVIAHPTAFISGRIEYHDAEEVISAAIRKGVFIELNEKYRMDETLLEVAKDSGFEFIVGTDSHYAESVGRYIYVSEVIDRYKLKIVDLSSIIERLALSSR
ncbi:MAG: PHP domain-containing protein [Candidatus Odinarchaeota archaeon]|nr:PHP domain-containing protein [Candidatus Odinarchaeota archaeon]